MWFCGRRRNQTTTVDELRVLIQNAFEKRNAEDLYRYLARPDGHSLLRGWPRKSWSRAYRLRVDAIVPEAFDAIVILGDMQAMDSHFIPVEDRTLLGICVADELGTYCELGLWLSPDRVLICLTGDLFTVPSLDKRGGTGDVISVYRAFAKYFPHVVAVAGNHDLFGDGTSIPTAEKTGVRVLNGTQIEFGEFTVGGICGIAGDNGKVWRNTRLELKRLVRTSAQDADLLLVHEPPKLEGHRGNPDLSEFLLPIFDGVVAAGHVGWKTVIAHSEFGLVLNLEGRGIVLANAETMLTT